jgi:DNA-binding response OmpR family regulator
MSTTVLVVEDDIEINELIGEYLALEDIRYLQATTGQHGIHQALETHPDAIILDLMLPDIDGFEVARSITTHRATYDIPIIILSCMCQECDREKGFQSGALFYMNKPFLPDDLLTTLRRALEWKENLKIRPPMGAVMLGEKDKVNCTKAGNQMFADIFARTDLSDSAVSQIREAVDTLDHWARAYNRDHQASTVLRMDYKINPIDTGNGAIEWKLSENAPGVLTEAFFKPAAPATNGGGITGLMGWGGGSLVTKPLAPIAPPATWLQVLAKTGAARFEKDTSNHTVRFARAPGNVPVTAGCCCVPVVEIDGNRYPTRLRDEALAAKRK